MAKIKLTNPEYRRADGYRESYWFRCPGCRTDHLIITKATHQSIWEWNGSLDSPTFSPSIKVGGVLEAFDKNSPDYGKPYCCHFFVKDGRIQFLPDCTHAMAGQTIEMPEVKDGKGSGV